MKTSSKTPTSTLLVGCGQVGTELGQQLANAGTQVYGLRRNPSELPVTLKPLAVDLTRPVEHPLPEVDSMVVTLTPTMPEVDGQPGYLAALKHLAQALPRVPSRVVFVSSTRVFDGNDEHQPLTEDDVPTPASARAHLLVEAEHLARELFDALIVRPAGIYGPGRDLLIRKVRAGEAIKRSRRTNRIHQTDLARALHMMLTMTNPPAILHAVDHTPGVLLGEVVDYIAQQLRVESPVAHTPDNGGGRILEARLLHTLLGPLEYPTYREGYDQLIATHPA